MEHTLAPAGVIVRTKLEHRGLVYEYEKLFYRDESLRDIWPDEARSVKTSVEREKSETSVERNGHIYFGDSLSTRRLKIECLHKSSPIRERVLNVRTSPLPGPKVSPCPYVLTLPPLFLSNPFSGPPRVPGFTFPLFLCPIDCIVVQNLPHQPRTPRRVSVSSVLYPSPRDQIKSGRWESE